MRSIYLILALLSLVASIPALYVGASLAAATGHIVLFPLPVLITVAISCAFISTAEGMPS